MTADSAKLQYKKMTETPIHKLIIKLAIPTVISMLMTSIYNMADTAFVGQLGNSASGAVGVVFSFMMIIQATGFMFGQGCGSIVSRLLGAKDGERATDVATLAFYSSFFMGILVGVFGFVLMDDLVVWLGSTPTIEPYAKSYMTYILFAAPFMVSSFVLNNVLRYEGRALLGMIGLLIGGILNIILDPILMFVFDMGISGAGLATGISQCVSFFILFYMFFTGKTECKIAPKYLKIDFRSLGDICATGFPSLLRQGLNSVATMILNNQAAEYGDGAVAAFSIVSRISMFVVSVVIGIGQGFQPVGAFNYGAKKFERVRKAYFFTLLLAEGLMGIISIVVLIFSSDIIQIFRDDATVVDIGTRALILQCFSIFALPTVIITEMLYQSTGKKVGASVMSALRSGVIFIPALIILSYTRGLKGIQEAQPLANVIALIPAVIFTYFFMKEIKYKIDVTD